MKEKSSFGVYPRRLESGSTVYYYWTYSSKGRRLYRSTGEETYEKAIRHCRNLLKTGKLASDTNYQFSKYTADFFIYDRCPYIKSRILHDKSYTKGWAQAQRNLLTKRIIPAFGDTDIRGIFEKEIEDWLFNLKAEGLGTKTVNHLMGIVRIIFGYALKNHDIDENPMAHIELFALSTPEKGIFTRDELRRLFSDSFNAGWDSKLHYALNLTAAMTGMRLGELLALRHEMVQPDRITVAHSWSCTDKLKSTKTGKTRYIPIPEALFRLLDSLKTNRQSSGFIFSKNGKTPIDHKTVYKHFYLALEKIGIDRSVRHARNLTFHSYRHGFNTMLLESGLAPETVRLLTGHSAGMTARYSHIQLSNLTYQLPF